MEKANVTPQKSLKPYIEEYIIIFKEFLSKPIQVKFVHLYVDKWSFNTSTIPFIHGWRNEMQ